MRKPYALLGVLALAALLTWQTAAADECNPSLYERLGGVYGIAPVVDDFVDRLLSDEVVAANQKVVDALNNPRMNVPGLKFHITALVCQLAGGPEHYSGRTMAASHVHLGITEREWDAMVADFKAALDAHRVPAAEQNELLTLVSESKKDIVTK